MLVVWAKPFYKFAGIFSYKFARILCTSFMALVAYTIWCLAFEAQGAIRHVLHWLKFLFSSWNTEEKKNSRKWSCFISAQFVCSLWIRCITRSTHFMNVNVLVGCVALIVVCVRTKSMDFEHMFDRLHAHRRLDRLRKTDFSRLEHSVNVSGDDIDCHQKRWW